MADLGQRTKTTSDAARATEVFYDGACPVCSREIAAYKKVVPGDRIEWSDVSACDAEIGDGLTRDEAIRRFYVRRADGRIISGAAAFLAVWRNIDRLRPLAILLDRQPFLWVGDRLYSVYLTVRPLWRRA